MSLAKISKISLWMIVPLGIVGSLLHFSYEWSGRNPIVAIFSAVNESYWEHIKIAFWPVLILQLVLFIAGGFRIRSYFSAMAVSLYLIPITMISVVFIYKNFTGENLLALDIVAFFLTITIAQYVSTQILKNLEPSTLLIILSLIFVALIISAFALFSHFPPAEPDIFIDPTTGRYGIN
jgi:hypothetical protein